MDNRPYPEVEATDSVSGHVPFVGWSRAAHEFRQKAAEFAPSGSVRPIFLGDPGVGKETMARAWLSLGHPAGDQALKFVDLDKRSFLPPGRYLGVTTYRPREGQLVAHLGRGMREQLPASPEAGETLVDAFWHYFDLALFMPPVGADRRIDVLAFLDYWHRARAQRARLRYRRIAAPLLHRLVFGGDLANNFDGLYAHLRMLGNADRLRRGGAAGDAEVQEFETLMDAPLPGRGAAGPSATARTDEAVVWSDEEGIPFEALPDLAVRMYLWCCRCGPAEPGGVWRGPEEDTDARLARVPLDQFRSGLTAREFLSLNEERFIREHVLPGAAPAIADRTDGFMFLIDRVRNRGLFGTSFRAIQEGLRVCPVAANDLLSSSEEDVPTGVGNRARTAPRDRRAAATLDETVSVDPDRFCIEDGDFRLRFHHRGRTESGKFASTSHLGLAYFRHLIRHPGEGFTPEELYSLYGGKGVAGHRSSVEGDEAAAGQFVKQTNYEEPFDQTALQEYKAKVQWLDEAIVEEERAGFAEKARLLAAERDKILAHVSANLRLGRTSDLLARESKGLAARGKDLNQSRSKLQDRVRKAMSDARRRIERDMPMLAQHLADQAIFKDGRWTYWQSSADRHWITV